MAKGSVQISVMNTHSQTGTHIYAMGNCLSIDADSRGGKGRASVNLQPQMTSQFSAIGEIKRLVPEGVRFSRKMVRTKAVKRSHCVLFCQKIIVADCRSG